MILPNAGLHPRGFPECSTCINREFDPFRCKTCVSASNYEDEDNNDLMTLDDLRDIGGSLE